MNSFLPSYELLLLDHSNVSTYRESFCGDDPVVAECFQQYSSYQHHVSEREENIQLIDNFLAVQENANAVELDNQSALTVPPVRQRFQANARERCRTQRCGSQRFLLFFCLIAEIVLIFNLIWKLLSALHL